MPTIRPSSDLRNKYNEISVRILYARREWQNILNQEI